MNVMILAAGEGTRLRPFTLEKPKPAIPFLGAPLASFSLALIENLKVHNLVVNKHHLADQVESLFQALKPNCDQLIFSDETTKLLGSGGGIHQAKAALEGRRQFLILNADEIILSGDEWLIEDFVRAHHDFGGIATLLTMRHPEVGQKFGGAWTRKGENQVQVFAKTAPGADFEGHHFVGAMVLKDKIFDYFKDQVEVENILYETLTLAMQQNEKVFVHSIDCHWEETGNPHDFLKASQTLAKMLLEKPDLPVSQVLRRTLEKYCQKEVLIEKTESEVLELVQKVFAQLNSN